MTLPSRGKRTITVDGIGYHWIIRGKATYSQECEAGCMLAAIELADSNGATLSVIYPWSRFEWNCESDAKSVTPQLIKNCIRGALEKGWQPDVKGPRFLYKYPEETSE